MSSDTVRTIGGGRLFAAWTAAVCAGTLAAAGIFAATFQPLLARIFDWEAIPGIALLFAATALAGGLHGLAVGWGEEVVLHRRIARIRFGWVATTSGAAALAWAACLALNLSGIDRSWTALEWVSLVVVGGLTFGALIGLAQWLLLRRVVPHAGFWIGANAIAWLAGSAVVFYGLPLADAATAPLAVAAIVITTIVTASLVAGGVTGAALVGLLRRTPP